MSSILIGTRTYASFSISENALTATESATTVKKPKLLISKRKVPVSSDNTSISTSSLKVVVGTEDAVGDAMAQKVSLECVIRMPVGAKSTDVDEARAMFQELVADASFTTLVNGQIFIL